MFIIDKTYFTKELHIPHIEEPTSDASIELDASIDRFVSQFLKETLGNVLFEELKTNITDGELDDDAPLKWFNLVDGCNYTIDGSVYTWQGLKYSEGAFKVSLLANYVYLNQYQNTFNSTLGQVLIEGKNGINADATPHLVSIWNEFIEMYQGSYNSNPIRTYRNGALFVDYFGANNKTGYVSCLQFLKDNEEDYPNVPAHFLEYKNSFGL